MSAPSHPGLGPTKTSAPEPPKSQSAGPEDLLEFSYVPELRDLLPKNRGLPGVIYAQVCVHHAKAAQDLGWRMVHGTGYYSIVGPRGRADMVLMCSGKPIRGAAPQAGARRLLADEDILKLTGLNPNPSQVQEKREQPKEEPPPTRTQPAKTQGEAKAELDRLRPKQ